MKKFLEQYKIQIIILLFSGLVVVFFYFLILPFVNRIKDMADEIQMKLADVEINEKRTADVSMMEANYNKVKENENKLNIVVNPEGEVDFMKELEALAEQTGNNIEFKIQDADKKKVPKAKGAEADIKDKLANGEYLSMQIAVEGSYSGFVNFVHKLENHKYYVNILSFSSEKKIIESQNAVRSPFLQPNQPQKSTDKEVLNSILDVVVYNKSDKK